MTIYFSSDVSEGEFETHSTLAKAKKTAEGYIDSYRDEEGWPPNGEMEGVTYGMVIGGGKVLWKKTWDEMYPGMTPEEAEEASPVSRDEVDCFCEYGVREFEPCAPTPANLPDEAPVEDQTYVTLKQAREMASAWTGLDLTTYIERQRGWSLETFGPEMLTEGLLDHIRKELDEIEADPKDLFEWVDVIILALDGAWRAGWSKEQIVAALFEKQTTNKLRKWPDWRTAEPGKAIEHIKEDVDQTYFTCRCGNFCVALKPNAHCTCPKCVGNLHRMKDSECYMDEHGTMRDKDGSRSIFDDVDE